MSEQITVTEPRVSTLGSRRTNALRATIRWRPMASTSVTTAGRPSGTAATARLTDRISTSSRPPPRPISSRKITPTTTRQTMISSRPSSPSRRCSGVNSGSDCDSRLAIRPSSVCMPVWVTTATAWPAATTVPAWTIVARSPRLAAAGTFALACLPTGSDSPVNADSVTRRLADESSRASAGTLSPASSSIRSPGTS